MRDCEVREKLEECLEDKYEKELEKWATEWSGHYVQLGQHVDMTFHELFIGDSEKVVGQGVDNAGGSFSLLGERDDDYVHFEKRYADHADWHLVYSGYLSEADTVLTGTWQLWFGEQASDYDGESGDFQLNKQFHEVA